MFVPHASIVSSPLVRVIQPPRDHAIRRIPPPLTCVVQTCRVLMPRASQFHRSRMRSSTSCAHATPFHHRFTAHAGVPACRVLMPHHATCIGPSLLMWVVQHAACSCHVPRTFAAHVCAPARRVLMRVVRPATCSCHMPRTFNAQAVHSHAVHMPCVSYPHRSSMCSATPCAVATCFHHLFSARARGPACRVLMARASYPPRSCVCSKTPCAHVTCIMSSPLAHALHHAVLSYPPRSCYGPSRRVPAPRASSLSRSRVLTPRASYPRRSRIRMHSVMRCAHATHLVPSPPRRVCQHAVRLRRVHHVLTAHTCTPACCALVPRASSLLRSCV